MAIVKGAMETELQIAERIARDAHAGQVEELTGDLYIKHVERVVSMVEGDDAKSVAWLHDALEDTPITQRDLREQGIGWKTLTAVLRLTRKPDVPYDAYIQGIEESGNELAIAVKIADLRDHLRPNCPPSLRRRYEKALITLSEQPAEPPFTESDFLHALKNVSRKVEKK